jgi:hypothetical protein
MDDRMNDGEQSAQAFPPSTYPAPLAFVGPIRRGLLEWPHLSCTKPVLTFQITMASSQRRLMLVYQLANGVTKSSLIR